MSYATGQIAGTYRKPDGSPQEGSVVIIPSVTMLRDAAGDGLIFGRLTATLVNGSFTVTVPASDDATLDPTGVTYTVAPRFRSSHPKAVTGVFVPGGATVQMADVTSVDPAAPVYAPQVTRADLAALNTIAIDTDGAPYLVIGA